MEEGMDTLMEEGMDTLMEEGMDTLMAAAAIAGKSKEAQYTRG